MMIGIKNGTFTNIEDVTESELRNIFTVKITYHHLIVRIILIHAPQETEKIEVRENFFEELSTQVERGITSSDTTIVIGDFNARIAGVNGVVTSLSSNGKLTAEMIKEYKLQVCNFSNQAEGKLTRIRANKDGSID